MKAKLLTLGKYCLRALRMGLILSLCFYIEQNIILTLLWKYEVTSVRQWLVNLQVGSWYFWQGFVIR